MLSKIQSALDRLWISFRGISDAYNPAAAAVITALLALNCLALAAGGPFADILSVHALLTGIFLSVMAMVEWKTKPKPKPVLSAVIGLILSTIMTLMVGAATWDWMVAQSDAQIAFDIRASVMQIMLASGYMGAFWYLNRAAFHAFIVKYR